MNTRFTYDFTKKAIVGTKASIKRANAGKNPEYAELTAKLSAHPDFVVIEKVINHKSDKKTYKQLTLKKMKEYIETQTDSENKLIEFEAVQQVAKAKGATYPLTKKWFLKTYPEFSENEISSAQTETLISKREEELKKAAAALADIELSDEDLLEEEPNDDETALAA